jgi:hypothetical protein
MQDLFADIPLAGQAPQGGLPARIKGPPKAEDPYRADAERRAEEDQRLQREAAARAREDQQFQREKLDREIAQKAADPKLVEAERTAAFLTTRLAGGIADLQRYMKADPSANKPSLGAAVAGGIFGSEARNWMNSPARRQVEAAQMDILDAALTLGTGAAYTKEQLEGYREAYFPKLTDDPATVADKRQRLRRVLEAAKLKAGGAAPQIDQALATLAGEEPGTVPLTPSNAVDALMGPEERQPLSVEVSDDRREGETEEQYLARIAAGDIGGPSSGPPPSRGGGGPLESLDAGVRGAADVLSLWLADEIAAVGNTVFNGGTMRENLRQERAIDDYDEQHNFVPRLGGQVAAGFALPTFGARTAGQLGGVGAGYGGVYGFNSGEGSVTDRLLNAGEHAVVGGALGAGAGAIANRLTRGRGAGPDGGRVAPHELIDAAANLGVDVLPADVGGAFTRRLTSAAAQSPISGGSIVRAGQRTLDQSGRARDRIAGEVGAVVDPAAAGEAAQQGAQSYIATSGATGGRLYDRAAELAGDVRIAPDGARQVLDRSIAELSESPMGAPQALTTLRERLNGEFTVGGLRNLRTQMRDEMGAQGLRGSDAERRALQAVNALTEDIAGGLTRQGRGEAAEAYRAADQFWRERLDVIDEVLEPIIGGKSGEQVFQALQTATRSNTARLRTFMRSLPEEEAATVRATVISQLGQASDGAQNAAGSAFSLNQFLTQWNRMTPRAKETLFRGETRASLDDLARVAEGSKAASGYANRSNTGGAAITAGLGYGAGLNPLFGALIAGNYVTGRFLASPRAARLLGWMARPGATPDQAMRRLNTLAAREPALAPQIEPIRNALEHSAPRIAANERDQDARR